MAFMGHMSEVGKTLCRFTDKTVSGHGQDHKNTQTRGEGLGAPGLVGGLGSRARMSRHPDVPGSGNGTGKGPGAGWCLAPGVLEAERGGWCGWSRAIEGHEGSRTVSLPM